MSEDTKPTGPSGLSALGATYEFGRRLGLQAAAVMAASGAIAVLGDVSAAHASSKSSTIKIGYVSPRTGALADFAGPDAFVISLIKRSSYFSKGITIGKTHYKIRDHREGHPVAGQRRGAGHPGAHQLRG